MTAPKEKCAARDQRNGATNGSLAVTFADRESPVNNLIALLNAKRSGKGWIANCPAHDDRTPSLSINEGADGRALLKCHAGCPTENVLAAVGLKTTDLFPKRHNGKESRVAHPLGATRHATNPPFDWDACVKALKKKDLETLAEERGYSDKFVTWMHEQGLIGLFDGCVAFPVHDDTGRVVGAHYRRVDRTWRYAPVGTRTTPLMIGDASAASEIHVFESPWDALAACDKLGLHEHTGVAVIATRGAGNGASVASLIPNGATVYAWPQNDEPGAKWEGDVAASCKGTVKRVVTPAPHKDANDWTWNGDGGASAEELRAAVAGAEVVQPVAEVAEDAEFPVVNWDEKAASSANSSGGYMQKAILPEDSILYDWFQWASVRTEGASSYIAGVILPILGAILGRRVWLPLGGGRKYANLYVLICGKPGDRKSTTIRLAASLARECLPPEAFIPASFSPESLFDEYDEECDGLPDKLWIADDANHVLTDWQKTSNGERVATRFLELYDCVGLSESFRRNKKELATGQPRRVIPETSTSVAFGATFNVCCFQGQTVRAGMARRFLPYVADRRGSDIYEDVPTDAGGRERLVENFRRCLGIDSGKMTFAPDAASTWRQYQEANRAAMDAADPLAEDLISRLASAPAHTLAVGMIFEAAMWAKRGGRWLGVLSDEALRNAIRHVDECLSAAEHLDSVAHRFTLAEDAEVLFERITSDFASHARNRTIYATRSDLTRAYCHDSGRRGALKPHELYHRIIPALIRQGKAALVEKSGKREVYGFRAQE